MRPPVGNLALLLSVSSVRTVSCGGAGCLINIVFVCWQANGCTHCSTELSVDFALHLAAVDGLVSAASFILSAKLTADYMAAVGNCWRHKGPLLLHGRH